MSINELNQFNGKQYKCPKGNIYESFKEMCKDYDISTGTVRGRLKAGRSLKEALNNENKNSVICPKGHKYVSFRKMCEAYGKDDKHTRMALKRGETLEVALNKKGLEAVTGPDGIEYRSIRDLSKKYGMPYGTVLGRMRRGKTLEEALEKEVANRTIFDGCYIDGIWYDKIIDIANRFNVKTESVARWIRNGYNVEDRLEILSIGNVRGKIDGVRVAEIIDCFAVSRLNITRNYENLHNYVFNNILWLDENYVGLTDNDMVLIKIDGNIECITFRKYIDGIKTGLYKLRLGGCI